MIRAISYVTGDSRSGFRKRDASMLCSLRFLVQAFPTHPRLKAFRNDTFHVFDLEVYHPASKVAST
jgi:hypothetical protein